MKKRQLAKIKRKFRKNEKKENNQENWKIRKNY